MKTLKIALFTILFATQARGAILEINEMKSIGSYIQRGTLVVFDIDNTVLEPIQTLGSDQWFDYRLKDHSVEDTIRLWAEIQKKSRVRAVESTTPALIQSLQDRGYRVIALTARPDDVLETSVRQLKSIGVRFSKIISIGPGKSKGETLKNYLQNNPAYKRVVFMDDKRKHVESVNTSLAGSNIEHFEFRYGGADERVHSFNPSVAECELQIFNLSKTLVRDFQCGGGANL